ncbi:MAG: prenyltransferase [Gammaproteobacteria bacterium]
MKYTAVVRSMRVPFLMLTPVCVFLGASTVALNETSITLLLLVLLGALLAQISVNALNEFADFKSGLDLTTTRTPFSGGSGALPGNPEMATAVFFAGVLSLMATSMIGGYLVWRVGAGIVPIGVTGLLLIVSYTGWINRYPFLCLIAPGVGFGFLMVVGTQFVLQGEYALLSLLVAVIPFFLVSNVLLLNQYPDIQADASVGRNHFPIAYGVSRSNLAYALFAVATTAIIVIYVLLDYLPVLSLVALLPMPLAFFSLYGAIKYRENIGNYPQYLGANVGVAILVPLLLGVSIMVG